MSAFSPAWRDPFGNSFEDLLRDAVSGIIRANPAAFRYDERYFPPLVIKAAVQKVSSAWGRSPVPPLPETPEDLMALEIAILEMYTGFSYKVALDGAAASERHIQEIESFYPGTLARVAPLSWLSQRQARTRSAAA